MLWRATLAIELQLAHHYVPRWSHPDVDAPDRVVTGVSKGTVVKRFVSNRVDARFPPGGVMDDVEVSAPPAFALEKHDLGRRQVERLDREDARKRVAMCCRAIDDQVDVVRSAGLAERASPRRFP